MKIRLLKLTGILALLSVARSDTKANPASTVSGLNPVAYWRLEETETAPVPAADVAVNLGAQGTLANGFYLSSASQPGPGALVGDRDGATYSDASARTDPVVPYDPLLNPAAPFSVEALLTPVATFDVGSGTPASAAKPKKQIPFRSNLDQDEADRLVE